MKHSFFKSLLLSLFILSAGFIFAAFTASPARPKARVAIFDFHGVIFDINKMKVFRKHLGSMNVLGYIFRGNSPTKLEQKAFALLCDMRNEKIVTHKPNWPMAKGRPMPQAMVDWQLGTKTELEIRQEINAFIANNPSYFSSKLERKLIVRILQMMFQAEVRLRYTEPIKSGVALVKWYKAAGYEVYGLTNNDKATMALLQKQYPEILGLFDDIISSADVQMMKPFPDIFQHLLKKKGLTAQQCCYFDDQPENLIPARILGFRYTHLCTARSMKNLHHALVANAAKPHRRTPDLDLALA
jgi:FMN phosphatase YigB (HAD superfamily)